MRTVMYARAKLRSIDEQPLCHGQNYANSMTWGWGWALCRTETATGGRFCNVTRLRCLPDGMPAQADPGELFGRNSWVCLDNRAAALARWPWLRRVRRIYWVVAASQTLPVRDTGAYGEVTEWPKVLAC